MADTHPIESSPEAAPRDLRSACENQALDRRDFGAMAALVGIVVFLFWRALFTSDMLYFRDIFNYSYPHARFIHEICRRGQLPYWNPFLNWGQPLLANPNTLFFYPFTILIVLLPIDVAYPLHYAFHFSIAALGAYLLARQWGQSRLAAFFAASVFAFSGPVLSLGNFYNFIACAVWIPWALLFTDKAIESRSFRPWLLLTGVFTLQFLAGEPLTLMTTFGLSTLYALYRKGNFRRPWAGANLRILGYFFVSGCLMMALAAIQFFPSLALLSNSRRGIGLSYYQSTYWSFHPLLLLEVLIPQFFGSPFGTPTPWKTVLNFWSAPFFLSFFIGPIPLIFALVGLARSRGAHRTFAGWSAVVLFLLALGRFTPLYELTLAVFPPLRLVRFPVKLLIPTTMFLGILGGWGFDALRDPATDFLRRRQRLLIPLAVVFVLFGAGWVISMFAPNWITSASVRELTFMNRTLRPRNGAPLTPQSIQEAAQFLLSRLPIYLPGLIGYAVGGMAWVAALGKGRVWVRRATPWVALLGIFFMVKANDGINATVPKGFYTYRPPVLATFQKSPQPYRFCYISKEEYHPKPGLKVRDYLNFDSVPVAAGLPMEAQSLFREKILLHWGTMLTGYEATSTIDVDGSLPKTFHDFWAYMDKHSDDSDRYDCLLGRTNVKYILTRESDNSQEALPLAEVFNGSTEPSHFYEDKCASPRAYAVASAMYSTDETKAFDMLSDSAYDALGQVILTGEPQDEIPAVKPGSAGRVDIAEHQPNSVTLIAELTRPGYVVLLDRFDPNWHATLDGHEVPILEANVLFRAVECPAGRHEIHYFYRQKGLKAGFALSLVTLILMSLIYWRDSRPRNRW
jgi:hypothetical protein